MLALTGAGYQEAVQTLRAMAERATSGEGNAASRERAALCAPATLKWLNRHRFCAGFLLMMKLLYKPFAIVAGLVASRAAGAIFQRLWAVVARETEVPQAMEQQRGWTAVVAAGLLKGAVFGGTKALVDRAFASEYFRRTGVWPGKVAEPKA